MLILKRKDLPLEGDVCILFVTIVHARHVQLIICMHEQRILHVMHANSTHDEVSILCAYSKLEGGKRRGGGQGGQLASAPPLLHSSLLYF